MKVGEGRSTEQLRAQEREGEKRQKRAEGEKGKTFSDLLEKQHTPGARTPGDERGRLLQEGKEQVRGREEGARLTARHGEPEKGGGASRQEGVGLASAREEKLEQGVDGDRGRREGRGDVAGEGAHIREPVGVAEGAKQAGPAQQTQQAASQSPALAEITEKIVNSIHTGEDGQARRVVFLDVTVPGHGDLRIRVRRDGNGVEVRMRADNDGLARMMRQNADALREQGKSRGLALTSIQVVR